MFHQKGVKICFILEAFISTENSFKKFIKYKFISKVHDPVFSKMVNYQERTCFLNILTTP